MYATANPFTPKSGIPPRYLVGREGEIQAFTKILDRSLNESFHDHFILLGEWGTGKTSLLKEFQSIAQMKGAPTALITTRIFTEDDKEINGVVDLVEQLSEKLPVPPHALKNFTKSINGIDLLGAGISFDKEKIVRADSPLILLLRSLKNMGKDMEKYKTILVLVDDAQNFEEISTIFMTFRQVLSDELIVKTNFLFGLACTPKAYNQFMTERNHPIGRYFARIHVGNLTEDDTSLLIRKNLKETGVTFPKKTMRRVYETTKGQPFEVQVYCSQLYDRQLKGKISLEHQELAEKDTIETLGQTVFDGWLENASEREKEALKVLANFEKPAELKEIHKKSSQKKEDISRYLERLNEKRLIEKPSRGHFPIPDYFYREYIKTTK